MEKHVGLMQGNNLAQPDHSAAYSFISKVEGSSQEKDVAPTLLRFVFICRFSFPSNVLYLLYLTFVSIGFFYI
jgi:hypothetical protein